MTRSPWLGGISGFMIVAVLIAAGCSGPAPAPAATASVPAATEQATDSSSKMRMAPDFTLEDLGGKTVSLSDSAGQVRLIDFWATWCAPCREEVPMLNELHGDYADRGLRILAISDEGADLIQEFVDEYDVAYTNLVGTTDLFEEYGALGLPTAYLVDQDGRIVDFFFGPKSKRQLEEKIRGLLEL